MMEATMGHRSTGLTRAKRIERLTLWLGLPLLLVLLSLTAGIVNYTPVRHSGAAALPTPAPAAAAPATSVVPTRTMPVRSDRLVPLDANDDLSQQIQLEAVPPIS